LYLQVSAGGSKTWIFRYRSPLTKKLRDVDLGPVHSVGYTEAGEKALAQRRVLASGLDPIEARDAENRRKALEAASAERRLFRETTKADGRLRWISERPGHCERDTDESSRL